MMMSVLCAVSDCWVWIGYRDSCGYGRIKLRGKAALVHRVSYVEFKGDIPEDHDVDHRCRNRACFNPAHLEARHYIEHRAETGISKKNPPKSEDEFE
jgi:hypothetical protein